MARYRKRPVEVEAVLCGEVIANGARSWRDLPAWIRVAYENGLLVIAPDAVYIKTLEGDMTAMPDDWIIQGVKGEIYPCKPDIFAATYEPL